MKVVLSHPYSGSIYWWFEQARQHPISSSPRHPYYRALFGEVDKHLDVALACALIYEDFVLPAADAVYPGVGELRDLSPADLGLEVSEWDPVLTARRLSRPVLESWGSDPVLLELFDGYTESDIALELQYAIADVLLAAEYNAPVVCSDGRRAVVRRLIDLGIVKADPDLAAALSADKSVSQLVDAYAEIAGLTVESDGVAQFADLKWRSPLREYADGFQRALEDPGTQSTDDLYEAIVKAMQSAELAQRLQGSFEAVGHVMDVVGLVPGVNIAAGVAGLGAEGAATAAKRRAKHTRWFELGRALSGERALQKLEAELRDRGLLD